MWRIGIIDDKEGERADIQVSILENVEHKNKIDFKEYEIVRKAKEKLFEEIIEDISEERIHTLIVDYKLDTSQVVIKGWEIVDFVHEHIPEFPVIIMTNVPEESKESIYIDADKVYPKIIFLDTKLPATEEMVKNILSNIQKYVMRRKELEGSLAMELDKLDKNSTDEEIIANVLELEKSLSKYTETQQTVLDEALDMTELREVLKELKDISQY